jgi:hypothetical protein
VWAAAFIPAAISVASAFYIAGSFKQKVQDNSEDIREIKREHGKKLDSHGERIATLEAVVNRS